MAVADVEAPVRRLLDAIAAPAALDVPDLDAIGDALGELARDGAWVRRWVAELGDTSGVLPIHAPERGPRLMLAHRLEGQMGAVHDHRVWVALAPVSGLESHRRYGRPRSEDELPALRESAELATGDRVTLLPPDDIHDHGHVLGRGMPAYCLILTADDQRRYERNEWDLETGRHRRLAPGDGGRLVASEAMPHD